MYERIWSIVSTAPETVQIKTLSGGTLVLGFQPISSNLAQAGIDRGENVLGIDSAHLVIEPLDAVLAI
ncbi:hypothetical protein K504DRAFT_465731 [Pleomassaria siparia CBS 279.74]|uniref:Uncharacterized protein n=1 Tax=Pleomassaria siparia CBS 279.74 TaxID=1314801 RepID=A0A6G1KCM7_9PLEO|nr:hypothetical protein K504DRAFT_465731 [Pleomassaria siparia CBS 279.74]